MVYDLNAILLSGLKFWPLLYMHSLDQIRLLDVGSNMHFDLVLTSEPDHMLAPQIIKFPKLYFIYARLPVPDVIFT